MEITELEKQVLKQEYPQVSLSEDLDIERYFELRKTGHLNEALLLYNGKLKLSRAQVNEALDRVGLFDQASQLPHELSGGERQRVAIARVLASRPAVVFADEPTAALDLAAAAAVLAWLAELAAKGAAVLMVTHDATAAARAGRVLVMDAGRVVGQLPGGDPAAVSDAVLSARAGGGR